ncbi:hypothetical protein M9434_006167 [Picochlorum sp. BPE23]|nr:hypothetical protein M9434_006167 [Picochlorum sp. BPE23]
MGDLGSESGKNVSKLLNRVLKRQKKSRKLSSRGQEGSSVVATQPGGDLQCGAPAVIDRDNDAQEEGTRDPEWEDVSGDEQDPDHGSLVVALEKPEATEDKQQGKAKRQAFTQEDRMFCQLIHRSHALCLLARGFCHDSVVRDDVLQSAVVSLVPQESLVDIQQSGDGVSLSMSMLESLVKIFHDRFKIREPMDGWNVDSLKMNYGAEDTVKDLLQHIRDAVCTAEECSIMFASLIDALGYPVRTVRHLDPSPLKPGDVIKRMKQEAHQAFLHAAKDVPKSPNETKKDTNKATKDDSDAPTQGTVKKSDLEYEREIALALEATSWVAPEDGAGTSGTQPSNNKRKRWKKKGQSAGAAVSKSPGGVGQFWVEVFCGDAKEGQWVHCDPAAGWVNRPQDVERMTNRTGALVYVVAFSGGGAKDVTRRYSSSFVSSQKQRDAVWWKQTMSLLRLKEKETLGKRLNGLGKGDTTIQPWVDLINEREDKELDQKAIKELKALPTTIEGFKNHVEYVLKRHVGKYQILVPKAEAAGMHKGEPYYFRKDLVDIHTADRWKRLGREVKPEELDRPCKKIKKRGAPKVEDLRSPENVGDIIDEGGGQLMSSYYAEWQTIPWSPPPAVDGKVPKNERGNIEAPPFATELPKGTVHVQLPQIAKICKKIGIEFAPALTGFDIRGGRSVPRIDGVVICQEFEEILRDAYAEDMRHQAHLAKLQRLKDGEAAWKDLLKALLTHYKVKKSYANDDPSAHLLQHASLKKDPSAKQHAASPSDASSPKEQQQDESLMISQDQVEMEEI